MLRSKPGQDSIIRKLVLPFALFVAVSLLGAVGLFVIERSTGNDEWTFVDAVYQSVITVTTVGLTEAHQLDQAGRLFTVVLAILGVAIFTYLGTSIAQYLITGELQGFLGRRRMENRIDKLSGHFIICGYGRMGQQVAGEFNREQLPVVVVDHRDDALQNALDAGYHVVAGDAGDDDVLRKAGIERAKSLITAIDDDAMNVMVTLTARGLNDKLFIIARANADATESKLIAAGADRVMSMYGIGGRRMAQMALRPNVVEFLEFVTHDEELELWLEEIKVSIGSRLQDSQIGLAKIREKTGANIVALRGRDGRMIVSPAPNQPLAAGDILIAIGTRAQLKDLRELAYGSETPPGGAG